MNGFSVLAFGGNSDSRFGPPKDTLTQVFDVFSRHGVFIEKLSRFYGTPAFPPGAGADYVNAAALVKSEYSPTELLTVLHRIEAEFGRERQGRWASRPVDIDLISHGDLVLPDAATHAHWRGLELNDQQTLWPDQLILPHPRLQDRAFVLVPVCDVAPDWVHPVLGLSMAQMLKNLPESARKEVVPL